MPSEAELLSLSSLEAMACGLPLLAANAVALPELVSEGVNGYLFQPGDDADAASYMEKLADHPELWADMGRAGWERTQDYSLETILQRNEMLYEMVLSGSHPSALPALIKKESDVSNSAPSV